MFLTIIIAVAVLAALDLPTVQKRHYNVVKPRPSWQEAGYTEYSSRYIY
jgi:hypothetical protein